MKERARFSPMSVVVLSSKRMASIFSSIVIGCFLFFEHIISELLSLLALIDMFINEKRSISLNTNSAAREATQMEMNQLNEMADQTEKNLQKALDSTFDRNEQLNMLLDRSDLLLHKNQAFGVGLTDYRKEIERKQAINRLKYIAIAILLLLIVILVIVLSTVVDRTNNLAERTKNVVLA